MRTWADDYDPGGILFAPDGSVKLPRAAGWAMAMAAKSGGNLTRQRTRERAEAVMAASQPLAEARGYALRIVAGRTFHVVKVDPKPEATP